jgi:hypothetical protein
VFDTNQKYILREMCVISFMTFVSVYARGVAQLLSFLTSALAAGEWSSSRPGRFTPTKETLC